MKVPFVSVIMPTYNAGQFLTEAIESILAQTFSDFEFIIIDDGSSDGSRDIIAGYAKKDNRIKPVFIDHMGISGAMNTGVDLANGDLIALMDHDDIARPNRLALQIEWMSETGIDICGSLAETFGSEQVIWWFPETHDAICRELLFRCALLQPTVLIKTHILKETPYNPESDFEDYEMWTKLATRYRVGNIPRVLLKYRRHEKQFSILNRESFGKDFQKYRFPFFYQLYPNTPLADYILLTRIADGVPMENISELDRAGQWLTKLADLPDKLFKERMAQRWLSTYESCRTALGTESEPVFFRFQPKFEA